MWSKFTLARVDSPILIIGGNGMKYPKYTVGVITISDKGAAGERVDLSGPKIVSIIEETGLFDVKERIIISDDRDGIEATLKRMADEEGYNLILTTGGTGFAPRDNAPEATKAVMTKDCPGISEYIRMKSCEITPKGMLSRGASVIRNSTLVVNLPVSPKAVREILGLIIPALTHGLDMVLQRYGECATREGENA